MVGLKRLLIGRNVFIKSGGRGAIKMPQPPGSAVLIKTTHDKSGVELEEKEPELLFLVNILPSIHSATHLKDSYFKALNPAKCCKNTN